MSMSAAPDVRRDISVRHTTTLARVRAVARAEATLLSRNRGTLFAAVVLPLVLPLSVRSGADSMDLKSAGLTVSTVLLTAGLGFSLLFAVYSALLSALVARREELVLKRLRAGELRDAEILGGAALPPIGIALVQSGLLIAGCTVLLHLPAPKAPQLAVAGVLLGLLLAAGAAIVTAGLTRTTESVGVTSVPFLLLSMLGSGMSVPLEILPDRLARVCHLLPMTPVVDLMRGGWTGRLSGTESLRDLLLALVWIVLAYCCMRRWFHWEPRR